MVQSLDLAEVDMAKAEFGRGPILLGFLSPALERGAKAMGRDVLPEAGSVQERRDTVCEGN